MSDQDLQSSGLVGLAEWGLRPSTHEKGLRDIWLGVSLQYFIIYSANEGPGEDRIQSSSLDPYKPKIF